MNARDLKPLYKEIVGSLSGFAFHKSLLLMTPMQGMLRAVHCDPSAFSKDDFQVSAFVMPLCVPIEHLTLTLGKAIGHPVTGGWGWSRKMPDLAADLLDAIRLDALPFLKDVDSAHDFADMARKFWGNPHTPKKVAFVLARAGHTALALSVLDEAVPACAKLDMSNSWQKQLFEDTRNFRDVLRTDPGEAQRKLGEWEDYTIQKLGLGRFR